jgi:hypothetical protein
MDTLDDIQNDAEEFARERVGKGNLSLWESLVRSSVEFEGQGCDGLLLTHVEKYIDRLLERLDDKAMYEIWLETENGIDSVQAGFDEAERFEMTHDIALDVCQHFVEEVCREARSRMKGKRRKG